jgi:hypothetical protein
MTPLITLSLKLSLPLASTMVLSWFSYCNSNYIFVAVLSVPFFKTDVPFSSVLIFYILSWGGLTYTVDSNTVSMMATCKFIPRSRSLFSALYSLLKTSLLGWQVPNISSPHFYLSPKFISPTPLSPLFTGVWRQTWLWSLVPPSWTLKKLLKFSMTLLSPQT